MTPELQLLARAEAHESAVAFHSETGDRTYGELLERSAALAAALLDGDNDLCESRVAYLVSAGFDFAAVQWGIWRAGGIAVPLSASAAEPELAYALDDSQATMVVVSRELADKVGPLRQRPGLRLLVVEDIEVYSARSLPRVASSRRAMILYTSGTTSTPKGVVSTHANVQAQIASLVRAWEWQVTDSIPLFLPLHHIHGIINVMSCALWSGAKIEPFAHFQVDTILERVAAKAYSAFMAVPTIYVKLIQAIESMNEARRSAIIEGFASMRLMVSGSAALPASVHQQWTALTSQNLLERYGMTEIGMALSNPFHGERRAGTVGQPLPGVELRLKSEHGSLVTADGEPGEIQVRGPCLFREYWNRPEVTADSFDDGWFRTGDMAVLEDGYYRIMGRLSVDIIKSGGYKLSALEIEAVLLQHPAIRECAVVGLADETWGEMVAAAVVLDRGDNMDLHALRHWCRDRLSSYKLPKRLSIVDTLPRNAMGKVTKPAVRDLF